MRELLQFSRLAFSIYTMSKIERDRLGELGIRAQSRFSGSRRRCQNREPNLGHFITGREGEGMDAVVFQFAASFLFSRSRPRSCREHSWSFLQQVSRKVLLRQFPAQDPKIRLRCLCAESTAQNVRIQLWNLGQNLLLGGIRGALQQIFFPPLLWQAPLAPHPKRGAAFYEPW
jgi:hypothetical protein